MTDMVDNPERFRGDVIAGFAAAYERYVERIPEASGLLRRGSPHRGKVSLVVGGGSGHYPSYAGLVGAGLADACVLGDVFTSPSAEQVYRVGRAAAGDSGVVLAFGNYSGDRLNFAAARDRLAAEGVPIRIVFVTDDIASAGPDERSSRRGIAGTAAVYKIGGAAAAVGLPLDDVERVMQAANSATFSYGVAFGGCTLPGASTPLFTVPEGTMEFGLGIHGEPGVRSAARMPAREIADTLVGALLAERPAAAGGRAAVIVNGLGATKYEELFLLYGHVDARLREAAVKPVLPEVGELVTSLDMAGCSLSLTWLDDELERLWAAPADAAGFRRGNVSALPEFESLPSAGPTGRNGTASVTSSAASQATAAVTRQMLAAVRIAMLEAEDELGQIDAVAGDGDHGAGMKRGVSAACAAADVEGGGVSSVLRAAGDAFGDRAGGTSGILWGILLAAVGVSLGDDREVTPRALAVALRAACDALERVGEARVGDKTMLDALAPFVDEFERAVANGAPIASAWSAGAAEATAAAAATASLVPRKGRARPLAARSVGTPDAGATSMAIVLQACATVLASAECARARR